VLVAFYRGAREHRVAGVAMSDINGFNTIEGRVRLGGL
jgi:hypothetical protein